MAAEGGTAGGLAPSDPQTGPDGEIIGGPHTPQQIAAQRRLQQTQAQVDEVVDIMKSNVEKVLDRDAKLSELDDRADALQDGASQFERRAKSLKNKFWLQNLKMMVIMGVIGVVIIGLLFVRYRGSGTPEESTPAVASATPTSDTLPAVTKPLTMVSNNDGGYQNGDPNVIETKQIDEAVGSRTTSMPKLVTPK